MQKYDLNLVFCVIMILLIDLGVNIVA